MMRSPWKRTRRTLVPMALAIGVWTTLHAESAILRDGRSIEVSGYRMSDDRIVLRLASGGEMSMPALDVLEIRRQPKEEAPVPPSPASVTQPTAPPAPGDAGNAPAAAPSVASGADTTTATSEAMLPIGGGFDSKALHEMAGKNAQ